MSRLNDSKSEIRDLSSDNISVCYIVKNGEKYIGKSIEFVKKLIKPSEILVVDTGSTDKTVRIAEKAGARIEHYRWNNNFANARNRALKMAKNDIVLFLDADEIPYEPTDMSETIRRLNMYPKAIGQIIRYNHCYNEEGKATLVTDYAERLFDKRIYKYEDAVHEQVVKKNKLAMEAYRTTIYVNHYGYFQSREKLKEKAEYYNSILFKELKKKPNDPYILFQIGKSYRVIGDDTKALEYFTKALNNKPDVHAEYYMTLLHNYFLLSGGAK